MYVIQDINADGRSKSFAIEDLEKRLKGGTELKETNVRFSEDGTVRFAPLGSFQLGEQLAEDLKKIIL
ncbi:MAG TPA: hypothetical protein VJK51_02760 [Candidatus Nanoarchaeia archaeon]|nr:hypothetical protein [Candidatus Nanoarchaeia archaeon]